MTAITMALGTSRLIDIPVRDENGNPFDMTGGRAVFWVGKSVRSVGSDVVIMISNPAITKDTNNLWTVQVPITPDKTDSLQPRNSYYYECRVWDQANNEYVIAADQFCITPSLTEPAPTPP